ncbi:MAG: hypothetical protein NC541_14395 [bacterium]|nr:hypothetical protein [bacterium]
MRDIIYRRDKPAERHGQGMVSCRAAGTEDGGAGGKAGITEDIGTSAKIKEIAEALILTYFRKLHIIIL